MSTVMVFCVVAAGPNVTVLLVNLSLCTSVETSTGVVPMAVMNSF